MLWSNPSRYCVESPVRCAQERDSSMKLAEAEDMICLFAQIKDRFETCDRSGLVCKLGQYKNCCVLKLQKPSWTNDPMHWIQNQSGIFFSVWNDSTSQKKDRIFYNIHALKLRELRGYAITGRDFAGDFRDRFEAMRDQWPNVRVDFGPATLMQGWIAKEEHMLGKNILLLMERFRRLSPIIDDLLTSRRR